MPSMIYYLLLAWIVDGVWRNVNRRDVMCQAEDTGATQVVGSSRSREMKFVDPDFLLHVDDTIYSHHSQTSAVDNTTQSKNSWRGFD